MPLRDCLRVCQSEIWYAQMSVAIRMLLMISVKLQTLGAQLQIPSFPLWRLEAAICPGPHPPRKQPWSDAQTPPAGPPNVDTAPGVLPDVPASNGQAKRPSEDRDEETKVTVKEQSKDSLTGSEEKRDPTLINAANEADKEKEAGNETLELHEQVPNGEVQDEPEKDAKEDSLEGTHLQDSDKEAEIPEGQEGMAFGAKPAPEQPQAA